MGAITLMYTSKQCLVCVSNIKKCNKKFKWNCFYIMLFSMYSNIYNLKVQNQFNEWKIPKSTLKTW
jgi:hypothetical protein